MLYYYVSWCQFQPYRVELCVFIGGFRFCFAELSPVCAVVGGVLGQEIIKVRSVQLTRLTKLVYE